MRGKMETKTSDLHYSGDDVFILQSADEVLCCDHNNIIKVAMDNTEDKELPEEEIEVEQDSQPSTPGIFDLPTEIITHIVSFLSLQGKQQSVQVRPLVTSVTFRRLQTGGHLPRRLQHHPRRDVLGGPPGEGVRRLLRQAPHGD